HLAEYVFARVQRVGFAQEQQQYVETARRDFINGSIAMDAAIAQIDLDAAEAKFLGVSRPRSGNLLGHSARLAGASLWKLDLSTATAFVSVRPWAKGSGGWMAGCAAR